MLAGDRCSIFWKAVSMIFPVLASQGQLQMAGTDLARQSGRQRIKCSIVAWGESEGESEGDKGKASPLGGPGAPPPPPLVNHGNHPLAEEGFPTIRCGRERLSNLEEEVEEVQEEQRQPTWSRRRKPEGSPPETEGGVAGLGECGNCIDCGATDQR